MISVPIEISYLKGKFALDITVSQITLREKTRDENILVLIDNVPQTIATSCKYIGVSIVTILN